MGRVKVIKKAKVHAPHVPVYIKKIMAMATLFNAMTTAILLNLHQHDRDGWWEIACAPHSWLSEASEENNIKAKARRVNLAQGFDLYQPSQSTWSSLMISFNSPAPYLIEMFTTPRTLPTTCGVRGLLYQWWFVDGWVFLHPAHDASENS